MRASPPEPPRALPAAAAGLYLVVVLAAVHASITAASGGPVAVGPVAAGAALLAGLDLLQRRRRATGTAETVAVLALRLALVEGLAALDPSGTASVLRVTVVLAAYFSLGRITAVLISLAYVAVAVVRLSLTVPQWWGSTQTVADVLMSAAALALAVVVGTVLARLDRSRAEARELVRRLEVSQDRLRSQADQTGRAAAIAERNHVARDIHDGLGHHLTAVSVQLQKAAAFVERDPEVAARAVADAQDAVRSALADVRRSVATLRSPGSFDLRAALEALAVQAGDRPVVRLDIDGDERAVDPAVLVAAYRVGQEALTNVRRHSGAGSVDVRVRADGSGVSVAVSDDGRGFEPGDGTGPGHGLRGMRERVDLLGGRLAVTSAPGRGTTVTAWLPGRP